MTTNKQTKQQQKNTTIDHIVYMRRPNILQKPKSFRIQIYKKPKKCPFHQNKQHAPNGNCACFLDPCYHYPLSDILFITSNIQKQLRLLDLKNKKD